MRESELSDHQLVYVVPKLSLCAFLLSDLRSYMLSFLCKFCMECMNSVVNKELFV